MVTAAIACFVLAALLGVLMLTYVVKDQSPPRWQPYLHGPLAAAGLVLLIIYTLQHDPEHRYLLSIVLFVVAALAGLVLFFRDLTGKPIPKMLAFLHGTVAVIAFLLVLFHAFGHAG